MRAVHLLLLPLALASGESGLLVEVASEGAWPLPCYGAAAAADEDFVYVAGGLDNRVGAHGGRLDRVLRLDPRTGGLRQLEQVLPVPLDGLAAAVLDGRLYVAGGQAAEEEESAAVLAGTAAAVAEIWGAEALVDGGYGDGVLAAVWWLDLDDPEAGWREGPPLRVPRRDLALVALDGDLVAVGGRYPVPAGGAALPLSDPDSSRVLQDCAEELGTGQTWCTLAYTEAWDPAGEGGWEPRSTWHLQLSRAGHGAAVVGEALVVAGGESLAVEGSGPDSGEVFAGATAALDDLPAAAASARGAALGGGAFFYADPEDANDEAALLAWTPGGAGWAAGSLPGGPQEPAFAATGGGLYAVSGRRGGAQAESYLEITASLAPAVGGGCAGAVLGASRGCAFEERGACADADGDGFGVGEVDGCPGAGQDCDDGDPEVFPGRAETCDGVDDDCDGEADEGLTATLYFDADADGFGDPATAEARCPGDAGWVEDGTDCDDLLAAVHPGATEACDGADTDCDGSSSGEDDADQDRWLACDAFVDAGAVGADGLPFLGGGDCRDDLAEVNPGATEVCGDDLDDDCDDAVPAECGAWGEVSAQDAALPIEAGSGYDSLGLSLAGVGDVDGDGYDDILLGALGARYAGDMAGAAYLALGPITAGLDLATDADARFDGATDHDLAGQVSRAGDVDGDGLADILVGAQSAGSEGYGAAYVIRGPASGRSLSEADAILSRSAGGGVPWRWLSEAGDVDGDGLDDLLIGAGWSMDAEFPGRAWLVCGPVQGDLDLDDAATATFLGEEAGDYAGEALAAAGDVDGDGHGDLLVGAEYAGTDDLGAVYLIHGPVSGERALSDAGARIEGERSTDHLGNAVAGAGDVDGDGRPDILVAASDANVTHADGSNEGAIYLFLSAPSGTVSASAADHLLVGEWWLHHAGWALGTGGGDFDGDGRADLLTTSQPDGDDPGAAYILTRDLAEVERGDRLDTADVVLRGVEGSGYTLGYAADWAGDVDADGFDDVLVSGSAFVIGNEPGQVFLLRGGAGL